ncbi:unnamed protein product, partial [Polarella glacialis]
EKLDCQTWTALSLWEAASSTCVSERRYETPSPLAHPAAQLVALMRSASPTLCSELDVDGLRRRHFEEVVKRWESSCARLEKIAIELGAWAAARALRLFVDSEAQAEIWSRDQLLADQEIESNLREVDPSGLIKQCVLEEAFSRFDQKYGGKFSTAAGEDSSEEWAKGARETIRAQLAKVNKQRLSQKTRDAKSKEEDKDEEEEEPPATTKKPARKLVGKATSPSKPYEPKSEDEEEEEEPPGITKKPAGKLVGKATSPIKPYEPKTAEPKEATLQTGTKMISVPATISEAVLAAAIKAAMGAQTVQVHGLTVSAPLGFKGKPGAPTIVEEEEEEDSTEEDGEKKGPKPKSNKKKKQKKHTQKVANTKAKKEQKTSTSSKEAQAKEKKQDDQEKKKWEVQEFTQGPTDQKDIAELGAEIDEESYERREALDSIRYTWTAPIRRKTRKMIQEMDEIVKHQALKDADKNWQFDQAAKEVDRIKNDLLPVSVQWSKSVAKLREPTAVSAVMKGRAS